MLKFGVHVIVCTPGRMIDLLCANSGRVTNLHRVKYSSFSNAKSIIFNRNFIILNTKFIISNTEFIISIR